MRHLSVLPRAAVLAGAILVALAGTSLAAFPASSRAVSAPAAKGLSVSVAMLPGVARLFRALAKEAAGAPADRVPALLFDFEQVLSAVAGAGAPIGHSLDEYQKAFDGRLELTFRADKDVFARDDQSYKLQGLGYSAMEIADMLRGRITRRTLDTGQKMLMLGDTASQVSDFLDREYRRMAAARLPGGPAARRRTPAAEAHVARYAAAYGVAPALVRAVITCESAWNQAATSRVGAVGVMQLMPGTARELGVNPYDLEQNIEGGTRYLALLLRIFKDTERALIAYNAGPGFTARLLAGKVALYGETREFVRNVLRTWRGSE